MLVFEIELIALEVKDLYDIKSVKMALKSCFSSKQLGNEEFLSDLVGNACSKCLIFF